MSFQDKLLDLLYPPRCMLCRRLLRDSEMGICRECRKTLHTVPASEQRRDIKGIELCVSPFRYEGAVRASLLRYKFHGVTAYGRIYADFIAKSIDENQISCDSITWVPLSRKRLRQRGYDQARIIAEALAEKFELPCGKLLEKQTDTRPQSSMGSAEKRKANASGVYVCANGAETENRTVLLVDDIVTTGATMSECAKVLRAAGCKTVYGAAAASRPF